ncbi:MAG: hypothetical protein ACR2OI_12180 [Acidimicrobiia bacterium]
MLRCAFLVVLFATLLGGCGGDEAEPTTTTRAPTTTTTVTGGDSPLDAVTAWFDGLAIGRYPTVDEVVVTDQFVLVLAVESYSVELYEDLAANGVSPGVSRTFWESFVAGVRGFTGADITEVDVLGAEPFEAYGRSFAEVEAMSPRGDLTVVVIQEADGRWYVDLLATFGPSFAPLFNLWVDRLPPDPGGPIDALEAQLASLQVARDRAGTLPDQEAGRELDALLERVGG